MFKTENEVNFIERIPAIHQIPGVGAIEAASYDPEIMANSDCYPFGMMT